MNMISPTMIILLNLFLVLTKYSAHLAATTSQSKIPEGRIIGGHEAGPHKHPYIVSLQIRFFWIRAHICGATLLNEYWILTAAHCISGSWIIKWLPLDAVAGTHNVKNFGVKTQISNIDQRIPHPNYKGELGPNDIALLKTKLPFTFTDSVQPIDLPMNMNTITEKSSLELVGWGVLKTTLFIPDFPDKLQELKVTYIPPIDCYKIIDTLKEDDVENPFDKDVNICTGPIIGGKAACSGDSGGPLIEYITKKDATVEETRDYILLQNDKPNDKSDRKIKTQEVNGQVPVVIGVVSWGISPCGTEGAPTVYTNVNNYINFINKHIKGNF